MFFLWHTSRPSTKKLSIYTETIRPKSLQLFRHCGVNVIIFISSVIGRFNNHVHNTIRDFSQCSFLASSVSIGWLSQERTYFNFDILFRDRRELMTYSRCAHIQNFNLVNVQTHLIGLFKLILKQWKHLNSNNNNRRVFPRKWRKLIFANTSYSVLALGETFTSWRQSLQTPTVVLAFAFTGIFCKAADEYANQFPWGNRHLFNHELYKFESLYRLQTTHNWHAHINSVLVFEHCNWRNLLHCSSAQVKVEKNNWWKLASLKN